MASCLKGNVWLEDVSLSQNLRFKKLLDFFATRTIKDFGFSGGLVEAYGATAANRGSGV